MAIDAAPVAAEVLAQIQAVTTVGVSCLVIWWGVRSFLYVLDVMGVRGGDEFDYSPSELPDFMDTEARHEANVAAWEAEMADFVARYQLFDADEQNLVAKLQERGMDFDEAVDAVDQRATSLSKGQ